MTAVIVVQARMGSTRLPGKVLRPLAGRPMLTYQLERLRVRPEPVVVATSDLARDDPVADLAAGMGLEFVRGSESDVLSRFGAVLDRRPASTVVRVTGDCPFTDPELVGEVLAVHRRTGADYTSNVHPRTFPRGLDVEVARADVLRLAVDTATEPVEREHVMPFLYRRPQRFVLAAVTAPDPLGGLSWVVDTAEDLTRAQAIAGRFAPRTDQSWREILATEPPPPPPGNGIVLRPATRDDETFLLALRNEADAVRWSTTGRAVTPEDHADWLAARLADPACRIAVVVADGVAVGQVRVDVVDIAVGVVSIAVVPHRRATGIAGRALAALQESLRGDVQIDRLRALVHEDHLASRRVFERAGFTTLRDASGPDGFVVHEWAQERPRERRGST